MPRTHGEKHALWSSSSEYLINLWDTVWSLAETGRTVISSGQVGRALKDPRLSQLIVCALITGKWMKTLILPHVHYCTYFYHYYCTLFLFNIIESTVTILLSHCRPQQLKEPRLPAELNAAIRGQWLLQFSQVIHRTRDFSWGWCDWEAVICVYV